MNVKQVLPPDAIPSIDEPRFGREYFGDPDERAIVIEPDRAPARAYPLRILHAHELVNDELDGDPVAITWCPLCWSAVVYDPVVDGRALTFGVSGKLADDDLVMYDRETGSEWKQSNGEAIAGPLAGERLTVLPAPVMPWERFVELHPDGVTLQRPEPGDRVGGEPLDSPSTYPADRYADYLSGSAFGREGDRSWDRDDLDPKEVVLGVERNGEAIGIPVSAIEDAGGVVQPSVGGDALVVVATLDGVFCYVDPGLSFDRVPGDADIYAADGSRWDGTTGESDDGRRLERVPVRRLFAFAWQDDHGPDAFYRH